MALIATANLGLVAFDMAYVPWRDFFLQRTIHIANVQIPLPLPDVTPLYDPIKGIEPHRDTKRYLQQVSDLEAALQQDGIDSEPVAAQLEALAKSSVKMVETNPFAVAEKSGTLEKIKNRMRDRIYGSDNPDASSRKAFNQFWSAEYLKEKGVQSELEFFKKDVQRLIETNYYRSIGENGKPTSMFFILDTPFVMLFGLELLLRSLLISRRFKIRFVDAVLWRWYDLLLLIPFWRFLRVIPVALRLDQAKLISLQNLRDQATRGVVSNIAGELTEAVLTEVLTQVQVGLKSGDIGKKLIGAIDKPYVDLNDKDEIQELVAQTLQLTVYKVLPKVKPEIEAVLRHPIEAVMEQTPGYSLLKSVPLVGGVPNQVNQRLIGTATEAAYDALLASLEDKVAADLVSELIRSFGKVLVEELQQGDSLEEIQSLLNELLDEVKVNYVDQISQNDVEIVLSSPRQVRQIKGQ
ncbi:hypothetical protein IQ266_19470 [filamentous cyanobacterium LEGE 11480]|uniref:Uncharacterized protein n=2 Tax=Romeriopsis TaxID=2992131 RepID=A0A928VTF8_9CYAN|nr:hypothetical protein [Romeriopsis navalis LEGE 11480]